MRQPESCGGLISQIVMENTETLSHWGIMGVVSALVLLKCLSSLIGQLSCALRTKLSVIGQTSRETRTEVIGPLEQMAPFNISRTVTDALSFFLLPKPSLIGQQTPDEVPMDRGWSKVRQHASLQTGFAFNQRRLSGNVTFFLAGGVWFSNLSSVKLENLHGGSQILQWMLEMCSQILHEFLEWVSTSHDAMKVRTEAQSAGVTFDLGVVFEVCRTFRNTPGPTPMPMLAPGWVQSSSGIGVGLSASVPLF